MSARELINKAANFAENAHKGQRYGDHDYTYHLSQVAEFARKRTEGMDIQTTVIIVAWLHDVLEDTDVTYEELEREFGHCVALACQDLNKEGKSYEEYMTNILKSFVAREVKTCDTMANLTNSMAENREKSILKYSRQLYILVKGEYYE